MYCLLADISQDYRKWKPAHLPGSTHYSTTTFFFLPVCVRSGLATVARQQVELKAVEVAGPEDARVVARLLHEGDDGLADVGRLEGVLVRLPRLRTEANFAVNATSQNICEMDLRPRGIIHG